MEMKHSRLGIASFVTSILVAGGIFLTLIIAGSMGSASQGGMDDEVSSMIIGFMIIGLFFVNFIAFVLGIAAFFQADRKKVFAILGVVITLMSGFGTIGLMVIGALIEASS